MAKEEQKVDRKQKALASNPQVEEPEQKRVRFEYIKSNCFRVIRVDGANGGMTPRGDGIQIALFSERMPIPTSEEFLMSPDGKLGNRVGVEGREGIIREVEVEAILSIPVAQSLCAWLQERIAKAQELSAKGAINAK